MQQINDYRTYLRDYAGFLKAGGFPEIHCECDGVVVIGRRNDLHREKQKSKLEAFRRDRVEIMSYDRLLDECELMQEVVAGWRGSGED